MLPRILKNACAVLCMTAALACGGGVEPTEAGDGAGAVTTEAQAPAAEKPSPDSPELIPPGCGAFKQSCCQGLYCNTGLECDPSTLRCLY